MEFKSGMKVQSEVILIESITYGSEPKHYYDDGIRHIYKFMDKDDNVFTWFTTKVLGFDFVTSRGNVDFEFINEGDKMEIRGTIKSIGEYKGEPQIIITRVKVTNVNKSNLSEDKINELKRIVQLAKYDRMPGVYKVINVSYREYKEKYKEYEVVHGSFKRTDHGSYVDIIIYRG